MRIIATVSGKGGVGKTAVSQGLALALAAKGYGVGLLDLDLSSSSQGDATGLTHDKLQLGQLIEPVDFSGVKVVSLFLFPGEGWEDVPTLMGEQRKKELIDQLFHSVNWGKPDFIIVDLPPGTGSEVRGLLSGRKIDGFILVIVPQRLAEMPVRRVVRMAQEEYHIPIIGLVENNAYNIPEGSSSSGKSLSKAYDIPLLAQIPWDLSIAESMDGRRPVNTSYFEPVAEAVASRLEPVEMIESDIRRLRAEGTTYEAIGKQVGLSKTQVQGILKGTREVPREFKRNDPRV